MLYLFILTLINGAANQNGWAGVFRISIGGLDFNLFFGTLLLVMAIAFLRGPALRAQAPTNWVHPALYPVIGMFLFAWIVGVCGMLLYNRNVLFQKEIGIAVRDFMVLPVSVLIGYLLTGTLHSAYRYIHIIAFTGVIVSILFMATFGQASGRFEAGANLNVLRTSNYVSTYAGMGSLIAAYIFLSGSQVISRSVAVFVAGVCAVGQIAPLNRSDWLAFAAGFGGLLMLLPKGQRLPPLLWSLALVPMLYGFIWLGTMAASAVTGRDFAAVLVNRVSSMLPGSEDSGSSNKAWETRLPSILNDFEAFSEHPITGGGFGVQEKMSLETAQTLSNFHHNAWTDFLAKAGLPGLASAVLAFSVLFVVSRRMVADRFDPVTTTVGALGVITAIMMATLGMATMSFNALRGAIPLGVTLGVVIRTREIQLVGMRNMYNHYYGDASVRATSGVNYYSEIENR